MHCRTGSLNFILLFAVFLLPATQGQAQSVDLSDNYNLGYRSFQNYTPLKLGSFNVGGSIGSSVGYDDNVYDLNQNEQDGPFLNSDLFLWMNSDWDKHAFRLSAYGSKNRYPGHKGAQEDYGNLFGYGRLDLPSDIQLEGVVNYEYDEDERGLSSLSNNPAKASVEQSLDTKVFFTKGFGDLAITTRAGIKFGRHPDVKTNGGNPLNRDDEDYRLYDLRFRGSMNFGENSNFYLEGGYNFWKFDDEIDRNGIERGSQGFNLAAGLIFQPTSSLSGEIAVGYKQQSFADNSFSDLSTFTLDAWATWALTNRFNLSVVTDTWFEEETNFNQAATLSRSLSFQADYRIHDRIRAFTIGYYLFEDYVSASTEDQTIKATIGVNFEITPSIVLTTQLEHKRFYSGGNGSDYKINRIWTGIKFSK